MKEVVAQFKSDWVERKIAPLLKKIPFLSSDKEAVMTKLTRKNIEGEEQFGKDWTNITPSSLIDLIPVKQRSKSIELSIESLETFAETWTMPEKTTQATTS